MEEFIFSSRQEAAANSSVFIYLENTGPQHIAFPAAKTNNQRDADINIYKDFTQDTEGTEINYEPKGKTDDNVEITIQEGGSYTLQNPALPFFAPGGSTGTATGGTQDDVDLMMMAPGESYLIEIQDVSGNSNRVSFTGNFEEV